MIVRRSTGFIEPCLPSKVARPPSGPLWVHEIKHDGYGSWCAGDGLRVHCFTKPVATSGGVGGGVTPVPVPGVAGLTARPSAASGRTPCGFLSVAPATVPRRRARQLSALPRPG